MKRSKTNQLAQVITLSILKSDIKTTKVIFQTLLFSLLIHMTVGCSKDEQMVIENNWQVESIKIHADSALQYPEQEKIYTFTIEDKKGMYYN